MATELVISFEVDGLHYWPSAPDRYSEFRQPHRHLFRFICWKAVTESRDPVRRDIELWELRRQAITQLHIMFNEEPSDFGPRSCEGIADYLRDVMGFSKVFVGEDEDFGALVT